MKFLLFLALGCLAAITLPVSTAAELGSRAAHPSATSDGNSTTPSFSPDGRFVVFVSDAKNLVTNGIPSQQLDVYLHDIETGRTELVSVNAGGAGGNGNSTHPSVSSNGLFVAFQTEATDFFANDTNRMPDVFVRDMVSGTTTPVSISTNGISLGNRGAVWPQISVDGGSILFETTAYDLFPDDTNWISFDVVLRSRAAGSNLLISADPVGRSGFGGCKPPGGGGCIPYGNSMSATMSDDAHVVVFQSEATNLVPDVVTGRSGVFVRDVSTGKTLWASTNLADPAVGLRNVFSTVSADGRYAFLVAYTNGTTVGLRFDAQTGTSIVLATNVGFGPMASSSDGRFVAIATTSALVLVDALNATSETICGNGVHPELQQWNAPTISTNGQRVAFAAANTNGIWSAYIYDRQGSTSAVVSVATNGTPGEIPANTWPVISRDGRRIAFESRDPRLVANDLNSSIDIFVRDLASNTTHVISRAASSSAAPMLRSFGSPRSLSTFAQVVAFTSLDHAFARDDDNAWCSAFVRDRLAGTNRVLATSASLSLSTNRFAFYPVLSTNGRYAAWYEMPARAGGGTSIFWKALESGAEGSVSGVESIYGWGKPPSLSRDGRWLYFTARVAGNPYTQVFRRDMFSASATNELLSRAITGGGPAIGDSSLPEATPDGKWTVFTTRSWEVFTNVGGQFPGPQLAARNRNGGVRFISTRENGSSISSPGVNAFAISGNSRYVFIQGPITLSPPGGIVYRHDLSTGNLSNLIACSSCTAFSVSDDGNAIAYLGSDQDPNIYLRDLVTGEVTLVSTNVTDCCLVGGSRPSFAPVISGDGRFVVFASAATNLVANDTNNAVDIFVHLRSSRTTVLVSRNGKGAPANASSSNPVLAPDGRTVVFTSSASDLVNGDLNNTRDVFVLRLGDSDSDFDGIDDGWEAVYFNTLARDGSGDFDGDGASDRQEFLAGTDPTNIGSIFRVITIEASGGERSLVWSAQTGRRYRVQFKDTIGDEFWEDLATVTAAGTTASFNDSSPNQARIYRVALLP